MQTIDYKINTRTVNGQKELFDRLRGRWVVITPEEHVRQIFIKHLISREGYPASHIAVESHFRFENGRSQRCDIIVYDSKLKPFMVVECKAQSVEITQAVALQASRYNAKIGASYILLTNLERTHCFAFSGESYSPVAQIPRWR